MQLENIIKVPADPDRVWAYLLEVEEVVQCMPGATLTEVVDDHTWKGMVSVSLGPMTLSYAGEVQMTERDEAGRRAALKAEGTETKGNGQAQAGVTFTVGPGEGGGTRLVAITELELTGAAASYGQGMISAVAKQISKQFARCVAAKLQADPTAGTAAASASGATPGAAVGPDRAGSGATTAATPATPAASAAKPIGGIRLIIAATFSALGRAIAKFGRWVKGLVSKNK